MHDYTSIRWDQQLHKLYIAKKIIESCLRKIQDENWTVSSFGVFFNIEIINKKLSFCFQDASLKMITWDSFIDINFLNSRNKF